MHPTRASQEGAQFCGHCGSWKGLLMPACRNLQAQRPPWGPGPASRSVPPLSCENTAVAAAGLAPRGQVSWWPQCRGPWQRLRASWERTPALSVPLGTLVTAGSALLPGPSTAGYHSRGCAGPGKVAGDGTGMGGGPSQQASASLRGCRGVPRGEGRALSRVRPGSPTHGHLPAFWPMRNPSSPQAEKGPRPQLAA